jgi:cytochrome c oxidase assembly protein subunit 15
VITHRHVLRLAQVALALQVALIASGAAVRVTGSGLGCPTWPTCIGGSLPTTAALGVHGLIEFSNRLLAVVMEGVGILLVLAVRRIPHPKSWSRLAWVQAAVVPLQAVIGGLLVLSGLNPYVLMLHFLASFPLVYAAAMLLHHLRGTQRMTQREAQPPMRLLTGALVAFSAVVLAVGTLVTGTGPHAGDPKVDRLPFKPRDVSQLHADAVYLLVGLTLATLLVAWHTPGRRWVLTLTGLLVAQAGLGYWQYYTGVPAGLVELHVLGASLIFTAATWLHVTSARPTPAPRAQSAAPSQVPLAGTATAPSPLAR